MRRRKGIIDKIDTKKLIKKELQKSNSKLKKLLDIGNRLKLGLDYRNVHTIQKIIVYLILN